MTNIKLPGLSPNTKIVQEFSTSSIEISYSRPSSRGRKVFGGIVAYDKIWRTGANGVTRIKTSEDLDLAGHSVPAGEYALYTIPGQDSWEVILNTGIGNWGTGGYDTNGDVARFSIKPIDAGHNYPTFTIDIAEITYTSCNIILAWDNVKVVIPVIARNEQRIDEHVDSVMETADAPHYQIATYYYEKQRHGDKAKLAIDKALDQQPNAFYMWHMKAKIEHMLGDKDAAIAAANKSNELSKGTQYEATFLQMNNALLAELN